MKKNYLSVLLAIVSFTCISQNIEALYFAQTHVVASDYKVPLYDEQLKLISNRDVLLKAQVVSPSGATSPVVRAKLDVNGTIKYVPLTGPTNLPTSFNGNLGEVVHRFDDSFTGIIPKEWMQPNLKVTIEAGTVTKLYDNLAISAPNKMLVTNFEVNVFTEQNSEFSSGWEAEFSEKFPASEFIVQNVRVLFKETSVPPTGDRIAARIGNAADYEALTGFTGFGSNSGPQNSTATEWKAALRDAAGKFYGNMKYTHVAWKFENRANKGVGGGYSSVSRRGPASLGILLHEMGHALSLPHWDGVYPYKGDMHGIKASTVAGGIHSGPIWYYDARSNTFIPPTQSGVSPLTYKNDPMSGGGDKLKEPGFLTNHFSDYSVHKMRGMLESHLVVYNENINEYAKWNSTTKAYTTIQANTGNVRFPVEREVDVISIVAAASSKTAQANIVYEPVGPYKSGLIDVFDPREPSDRTKASSFICGSGGCDTTLKIEQGTTTKYIMLPMSLDATLAATNPNSFVTRAVNLRASDGAVTKVQLLATPNAEINGLPTTPAVLATWQDASLSNDSIDKDISELINMYKIDNTLKITGFENSEKVSLKLFSITGKEVFAKNLMTQKVNTITLPNVAVGVYVVHIISDNNKYTKKIIIN